MDRALLLPNLISLLTPIFLQSVAYGQLFPFVPGKLKTRPCETDHDCGDGSGDMVCWYLYEGCNTGQCMCDPRTHVTHSTGRCVRVRRAYEPCDGFNDTCSDLFLCVNGTCQCPHQSHHHQGQLFTGLCIPPNFRPLGSRCNPSNVCYHESAYGLADNEVECSRRDICQCKDGYKQYGRSCRKVAIWEKGCKKNYECEGGAVCVDEQCACPTGYRSVAGNTKCVKYGATLELPLRARCDEINERSYCSQGLVCHRCQQNEGAHICARYYSGFKADNSALQSGACALLLSAKHNAFICIALAAVSLTTIVMVLVTR